MSINYEEAESYIKAAELELGPDCESEWAIKCAEILRKAISKNVLKRERPPIYYRPIILSIKG